MFLYYGSVECKNILTSVRGVLLYPKSVAVIAAFYYFVGNATLRE